MDKDILHIVNGDSFASRLETLNIPGEVAVWREMLCDGPTAEEVGGSEFVRFRESFLTTHYGLEQGQYHEQFVTELEKIKVANPTDGFVLWFEYDLFCHLNLLAAIAYLQQQAKVQPIYVICSGWEPGYEGLVGLSQLKTEDLKALYEQKVPLTSEDLKLAAEIWNVYNSGEPKDLQPYISKKSSFTYLGSCLRAHLERFADSTNGLNVLEENMLKLIDAHEIHTENQLLGYALKHQGFYGFGDLQLKKIMERLCPFYTHENGYYRLTSEGEAALSRAKNFIELIEDDTVYGRTQKYRYLYNRELNQVMART
ncbi:DUF1835 domain-containing protein [Croceiramulus getboli]|nr:DUF1835 domain-containing protein [Flavobacteriaceae bacterium YJPT1-3]